MIEPKVMVGNLKSLRTYADVRDAVRAYYMLVTVNPIAGEYYIIGGSYTCEVGDTLNTLISYSTKKDEIQVVINPERLRPIDADCRFLTAVSSRRTRAGSLRFRLKRRCMICWIIGEQG